MTDTRIEFERWYRERVDQLTHRLMLCVEGSEESKELHEQMEWANEAWCRFFNIGPMRGNA
jgi:hypothetical protein